MRVLRADRFLRAPNHRNPEEGPKEIAEPAPSSRELKSKLESPPPSYPSGSPDNDHISILLELHTTMGHLACKGSRRGVVVQRCQWLQFLLLSCFVLYSAPGWS